MKKKDLEKTLEEEFKDIRALLNGIDRFTKKCLPEEECESACIKGLKQGNELLQKLTDEQTKDNLFSELVEVEYDLAGKLVEKEQYGKAIEHFQNLNNIGREVHNKRSKLIKDGAFNKEFTKKSKENTELYKKDDIESIEKWSSAQAEIEKPFTFNREAEKLIFSTHLSLAYIYAFKRDIKKVVDETIEALNFTSSDTKLYGCVGIKEFVPFNLRDSRYHKPWFKKVNDFRNHDTEEDAHVVLCGMSEEESDRLMNSLKIYQPKIYSFKTIQTPLDPFEDSFKTKSFDLSTSYDPFKMGIPKTEEFKFKDTSKRGKYKEDVANRRKYCKELMCFVIVDNKFKVNEETLNAAYKIIATDPTDPGSYLFLMALLEQEDKNKEVQDMMGEVVRLISTKASIKDYDSESINPNYESVLKADRYVSKPETEEKARKQHILSNLFYKHSQDKERFVKSYGYAKGVDGKFYLVTELLNEDNLSTFDRVLSRLKYEEKKEKLEQVVDILVEMQGIYRKNKDELNKEIQLSSFDSQEIKEKIIGRLKPRNKKKLEDAIQFLIKEISNQEKCFSHGDYHSENIIEKEKIAVIDFANFGNVPLLYDITFLLEDSKLQLDDTLKEEIVGGFLKQKGKKLNTYWKKKCDYMFLFINLRRASISSRLLNSSKNESYKEDIRFYLEKTNNSIDKMIRYTTGKEYSDLIDLKKALDQPFDILK